MNVDCKNCYEFEERAAIIEHDGGFEREESDRLAELEVCSKCKKVQNKS